MENTTKKYGQTLSFLPLISFTLWTIYFLFINERLIKTETFQNHIGVVTDMLQNYNALLFSLIGCVVITTISMLIFTVHIARLKSMDAGTKIAWMIFMVTFGAFALPVFYFLELRGEPSNIEVYPDIA